MDTGSKLFSVIGASLSGNRNVLSAAAEGEQTGNLENTVHV